MELSDKLLKPVIETRYLSVDNTDRYRSILRFFYLNYEKLKYWLYQEEVFEELHSHAYFADYTLEQCQQDLAKLTEWKNLVTIQDTRKVSSVEEFKNKKFRYQLSEYSVEIERLVLKLENLFIEGASLEPTLLERMNQELRRLEEVLTYDVNHTYSWWNDLNNDFIRLNQNYQDYIRDLNSVKAEEMMKSKSFLVFKDRLMEYLRNFVKSLQTNSSVIESLLRDFTEDKLHVILKKVVEYELSIPRMEVEINEKILWEKHLGRYESLIEWFVGTNGRENESEKLFDATNKIIQRITRFANQISEQSGSAANRKEEYAKIASIFMKAGDMEEAHRLAASIFGVEKTTHLKGLFERDTDSMNSCVYDEKPEKMVISPRVRNYREKTSRSTIVDRTVEKQSALLQIMEEEKIRKQMMEELIADGEIDLANIPVIKPEMREILLNWISRGLEDNDRVAKTEEGRQFRIDIAKAKERCKVVCEDGIMDMPHFRIQFQEA